MTDDNKPWERQPYDTSTSFDRFQRYYLVQDPPRSVDEAYRRWKQDKCGKSASEVLKMRANGVWQQWAWPKGDNVLSWPERANAYDDYLAQRRMAEYEAQRMPPAEVLALLSQIARGDIGELANVIALQDLEEHERSALVQSIQSRTNEKADGSIDHSFKFKLYSKLDALEKLARHYGLYDDKLDVTSGGERIKVAIIEMPDESVDD